MQEQVVSFETAKLAKEKGFDVISGVNFFNKEGTLMGSKIRGYEYLAERVKVYPNENILAPTQSLLQKWLREVHNIILNIEAIPDYTEENKKVGYYFSIIKDNDWVEEELEATQETIYYLIYEEVLEKGLKCGLELIK